MKLFLLIYILGSFTSILLTIFLIKDISNNLEEIYEKTEDFILEKFNIYEAKKFIKPNVIFISNFFWSWIFVIIFILGYLKIFINRMKIKFKK
jgi:hypothetical protein